MTEPNLTRRRREMQERLLAYVLRGYFANGRAPVDRGAGVWESLSEEVREGWLRFSAMVLSWVETHRFEDLPEDAGKPRFVWRGDAADLATQIAVVLPLKQLQEMAGEMALSYRQRHRLEKEGAPKVYSPMPAGQTDCPHCKHEFPSVPGLGTRCPLCKSYFTARAIEKKVEQSMGAKPFCDHKFVDSKHCLKCGIGIDELRAADAAERAELERKLPPLRMVEDRSIEQQKADGDYEEDKS